jgi:hypothetical protein
MVYGHLGGDGQPQSQSAVDAASLAKVPLARLGFGFGLGFAVDLTWPSP